tara:strand:+ start:306 stop:497 length:192 start_codon:yes stop_codon:yes gene_type:complete
MIKIGYTKNDEDNIVESVDSLHIANSRVIEIKNELDDQSIQEFFLQQQIADDKWQKIGFIDNE